MMYHPPKSVAQIRHCTLHQFFNSPGSVQHPYIEVSTRNRCNRRALIDRCGNGSAGDVRTIAYLEGHTVGRRRDGHRELTNVTGWAGNYKHRHVPWMASKHMYCYEERRNFSHAIALDTRIVTRNDETVPSFPRQGPLQEYQATRWSSMMDATKPDVLQMDI